MVRESKTDRNRAWNALLYAEICISIRRQNEQFSAGAIRKWWLLFGFVLCLFSLTFLLFSALLRFFDSSRKQLFFCFMKLFKQLSSDKQLIMFRFHFNRQQSYLNKNKRNEQKTTDQLHVKFTIPKLNKTNNAMIT